jgi:exo-1,4-beta-D-glucosaminidase
MTYEAERAMFEAYGRRKYVATGVIQWMLNNAWPSLIWHLYDYYLAAGGGYYGTKKALEPLHVQYSPEDRTVVVVNSGLGEHADLAVRAQVFTEDLSERYAVELPVSVGPDSSTEALVLPDVDGVSPLHFVRVELREAGAVVSTNFYWLSTSPDVVDWENANWFSIPTTAYADLTALADLPAVSLDVATRATSAAGEGIVTVTVTNPGPNLAFMVRLSLREGPGGAEVLPTRWQDNFFSLLPGETREVTARYSPDDVAGVAPVVQVRGWNVVPSST